VLNDSFDTSAELLVVEDMNWSRWAFSALMLRRSKIWAASVRKGAQVEDSHSSEHGSHNSVGLFLSVQWRIGYDLESLKCSGPD